MLVEGLRVEEISINLAHANYYVTWNIELENLDVSTKSALQKSIRNCCLNFDWELHCASVQQNHIRLLLKTPKANLEQGLCRLMPTICHHRIYIVEPGSVLSDLKKYLFSDSLDSNSSWENNMACLPFELHFGFLIGSQDWASQTLETLSNPKSVSIDQDLSLKDIVIKEKNIHQAIVTAHETGKFKLKEIADYFDMHFSDVSAVVNQVK